MERGLGDLLADTRGLDADQTAYLVEFITRRSSTVQVESKDGKILTGTKAFMQARSNFFKARLSPSCSWPVNEPIDTKECDAAALECG